jgi:hypothetical protein
MGDYSVVMSKSNFSEGDVISPGTWDKTSRIQTETAWSMSRLGESAGLIFALISASVNIPELLFIENKRRNYAVSVGIYRSTFGKRISRLEALHIVHQIMEDANRERAEFIQKEADEGIQWKDEI